MPFTRDLHTGARNHLPARRLTLKTDLSHLPEENQAELARVRDIILSEFDRWRDAGTQVWRKNAKLTRIILYGSFARGDQVDERDEKGQDYHGYQSDYDILVTVPSQRVADEIELWDQMEDRLLTSPDIGPVVSLIRHTNGYVANALKEGRYFFADLTTDGIALYEAKGAARLPAAEPLTEEAAEAMAKKYYDEWFPSAASMLDTAQYSFGKGELKESAFLLHQAVERFYHCTLLTHTLYSPASHNIKHLRGLAEQVNPALIKTWPREDRQSRARFELLKEAYVKARYSESYTITEEELQWLIDKTEHLREHLELRQ